MGHAPTSRLASIPPKINTVRLGRDFPLNHRLTRAGQTPREAPTDA